MDPTCREYLDAVVSAANKGDQFAQAILPTVFEALESIEENLAAAPVTPETPETPVKD
jgi:hypothetical protein